MVFSAILECTNLFPVTVLSICIESFDFVRYIRRSKFKLTGENTKRLLIDGHRIFDDEHRLYSSAIQYARMI